MVLKASASCQHHNLKAVKVHSEYLHVFKNIFPNPFIGLVPREQVPRMLLLC